MFFFVVLLLDFVMCCRRALNLDTEYEVEAKINRLWLAIFWFSLKKNKLNTFWQS